MAVAEALPEQDLVTLYDLLMDIDKSMPQEMVVRLALAERILFQGNQTPVLPSSNYLVRRYYQAKSIEVLAPLPVVRDILADRINHHISYSDILPRKPLESAWKGSLLGVGTAVLATSIYYLADPSADFSAGYLPVFREMLPCAGLLSGALGTAFGMMMGVFSLVEAPRAYHSAVLEEVANDTERYLLLASPKPIPNAELGDMVFTQNTSFLNIPYFDLCEMVELAVRNVALNPHYLVEAGGRFPHQREYRLRVLDTNNQQKTNEK